MKIKFTCTVEVDENQFPHITKPEIKEEVLSYLTEWTNDALERAKSYLADENITREWAKQNK